MTDRTFFNVLIGPCLIFSIIYFILAIFSLLRLSILSRSYKAIKIGKAFYINIFLTCLFRTITSAFLTYLTIAFQRDIEPFPIATFNKIFLNYLYLPDILIWNCFAFLFWQLVLLFYKGHLQQSYEDFNIFSRPNYNPLFQLTSFNVFIIIVSLSTALQIIFFTLVTNENITIVTFLIMNTVFAFIIPVILLLTEFYLHIHYSGLPYRTLFDSENKGRINKRIVYWGFARTIHGIIDLLIIVTWNHENFNDNISEKSSYSKFVLYVIVFFGEKILTEIVAYLLVFDMDFMTIFFTEHDLNTWRSSLSKHHQSEDSKHEGLLKKEPGFSGFSVKNTTIHVSFDENIPIPKIEINLLMYDSVFGLRKRVNGLGEIKSFFYSKDKLFKLCVREVATPKLSKYIIEETIRDLSILSDLQANYPDLIVKIKGYDYLPKENKIYFMYEFFNNGNLADTKKELFVRLEDKLRFLVSLARVFETLHSFEPPLIHGHLTSQNILIDRNLAPKISDLLLRSFKKFCGIAIGYSNKNAYVAPEYLEERGGCVVNPKKAGDVYSFAMIMWELLVEKEPFQGMSGKMLKNIVCGEKSRPKIPNTVPEELANIIRVCWQQEQEKRPEFSLIVKSLENFGYLSDSQIE